MKTHETTDFVLPWVDGSDLEWINSKNKYNNSIIGEHNAIEKYRDMGTLKYVLRSIEKNCPWYNKIHIITCGHHPKWLDIKHPKINLITHKELYFKKAHLPVFSSSSIEMNLANMRDVSEQFVYLNDDMLIMKQTKPTRFFKNGRPVDFLSHGWIPRNKLFEKLKGIDTWIHSINNNLDLINTKFSPFELNREYIYHSSYSTKIKLSNFILKNIYKKIIWFEHWHHPQPYLLSDLREVYRAFPKEMMICSKNRFRANTDLTQYLYRYWRLVQEDFAPSRHNDGLAENIKSEKQLKNIFLKMNCTTKPVRFACFNDAGGMSDKEYEKIKILLIEYLENIFSSPASFENK